MFVGTSKTLTVCLVPDQTVRPTSGAATQAARTLSAGLFHGDMYSSLLALRVFVLGANRISQSILTSEGGFGDDIRTTDVAV